MQAKAQHRPRREMSSEPAGTSTSSVAAAASTSKRAKPTAAVAAGEELGENALDFSKADRRLWLVKVPDFVAEEWGALAQEGAVLGKLLMHTVVGSHDMPTVNNKHAQCSP